eukprot:scaffold499_cov335-Pavlova_lutheri.AAC.23
MDLGNTTSIVKNAFNALKKEGKPYCSRPLQRDERGGHSFSFFSTRTNGVEVPFMRVEILKEDIDLSAKTPSYATAMVVRPVCSMQRTDMKP